VLLVDDILFFPVHGILWILREIHKTAEEEWGNQAESITQQLRSLYMQLETGGITEEIFDAQEKILLDRLDEIEASEPAPEDEEVV
jgi:Gas vesicle protein G